MGKPIKAEDRSAMDALFASESNKMAVAAGLTPKAAASAKDISDDNGKEQGPQAFKDHAEYVEVVTSVLNDDKTDHFDPNDQTKD